MSRSTAIALATAMVAVSTLCVFAALRLYPHTIASISQFGFIGDDSPARLLSDRYTDYVGLASTHACPENWYAVNSSDPGQWLEEPYDLSLDDSGVVLRNYGLKYRLASWQYSPQFVAWFGLVGIRAWCESGDSLGLAIARRQAEWLLAAADTSSGAAVWRYAFPNPRFRAPEGWAGGIANGFALVHLTQMWLITDDPRYHEMAVSAVEAFARPMDADGLRGLMPDGRTPFFEEVAHSQLSRPAHILNGHIFALLALDYFGRHGQHQPALDRRDEGIEAVRRYMWDFDAGETTYYSLDPKIPVPPTHYAHGIHVDGLYWMGAITGNVAFLDMADRWNAMLPPSAQRIQSTGQTRSVQPDEQ